jgi:hypothetical protein
MFQIWLVHCPYCVGAFTAAVGPNYPDFSEVVSCNRCNRDIDANKGKWSMRPVRLKKPKPVDLLKVS